MNLPEQQAIELLSRANLALIELNGQGEIVRLNAAARELHAADDTSVGLPYTALVPEHQRARFASDLAKVRKGRSIPPKPTERLTVAGERVAVEVTLLRLGAGNDSDGTLIIGRDLRQQEAEKLQLSQQAELGVAIVQTVIDGVLTIDESGYITLVNPSAEKIFRYRGHEMIGRNVSMLMPEPYRSQHDGYLRSYADTGERKIIGIGREVVGLRSDGSSFPMELAVAEMKVGGVVSYLGIVRDISARRQREAERDQLLAEDAHQRGVVDSASGLLHDLGNVMTGVSGLSADARKQLERSAASDQLELLSGYLGGHVEALETALGAGKGGALLELIDAMAETLPVQRDAALACLSKMLSYVTHAQELLNTFRSVTGAEAGPGRNALQIEAVLEDARLLQIDTVTKRKGTIALNIAHELPKVRLERSKLMQVMLNLLKNAIEACDSASPTMAPAIVIRAESRPDGEIRIETIDNGPGFDESQKAQLFDKGYSTRDRASGMGLNMSRRVIESMGGTLSLSSAGPGKGATATIQLPVEIICGH